MPKHGHAQVLSRSWFGWDFTVGGYIYHPCTMVGLQVIEDDLVAAKQADRSLSSQDFSRLALSNYYAIVKLSSTLFYTKRLINSLLVTQIADNGAVNVSELWRNLHVIGTLANGERIGEAKKGED